MTSVKCSGCETIIEIPEELAGDIEEHITRTNEPVYCDECEWVAQTAVDAPPDPSTYCPHCGKDYEDFSDYGCVNCDRRL